MRFFSIFKRFCTKNTSSFFSGKSYWFSFQSDFSTNPSTKAGLDFFETCDWVFLLSGWNSISPSNTFFLVLFLRGVIYAKCKTWDNEISVSTESISILEIRNTYSNEITFLKKQSGENEKKKNVNFILCLLWGTKQYCMQNEGKHSSNT